MHASRPRKTVKLSRTIQRYEPVSKPIVSFFPGKFLLCFVATVLTFFIAGLLYLLRFDRVDNLGAYGIPPETGLLIPSGFASYGLTPNRATILGMRTDFLLGAMLVLATSSIAAQTATGIRLADVRFRGDTQQLAAVDLTKCATDLKSETYEGPEWSISLAERVQLLCLQDNGYFKAAVKPSTEQLSDKGGTHQFVVTFDINAGPQYRAGEIGFKNNRVFPADELRSMFKLASGDIFSVTKIREGLNQMHTAYAERHHLNFTAVPGMNVDDSRHVISLVFDCDEGEELP